jgi:hypothetical protein
MIKTEVATFRIFTGVAIFLVLVFAIGLYINLSKGALDPQPLRSAADLSKFGEGSFVKITSLEAQPLAHKILFSETRRMRTVITPTTGAIYYISAPRQGYGFIANVPEALSADFRSGGEFYAIVTGMPQNGGEGVLADLSAATGLDATAAYERYNATLFLDVQPARTPLGLCRNNLILLGLAAMLLAGLRLTRRYRITHYQTLPFYAKLRVLGEPADILADLEEQAERSTALFFDDNLLITDQFLVSGKDIFPTANIMWLHLRYIYGVTTIFLFLADASVQRVPCPTCDDATLERVQRACPDIIVGYSEDIDKMSHQERLQYWDYYRSHRQSTA